MKIRKNGKARLNGRQGFTLVELLLVMAIIGILAGIISMGMSSSRKKARATAAMETAKSIKVEMADCYLKSKPINPPPFGHQQGGGAICTGAGNYPDLPATCKYLNYSGTNILTIICGTAGGSSRTIACDIVNGGCGITINP